MSTPVSNGNRNPYVTGTISKSLLTPCRRIGLSRIRKTPASITTLNSPLNTPLSTPNNVSDTGTPLNNKNVPIKDDSFKLDTPAKTESGGKTIKRTKKTISKRLEMDLEELNNKTKVDISHKTTEKPEIESDDEPIAKIKNKAMKNGEKQNRNEDSSKSRNKRKNPDHSYSEDESVSIKKRSEKKVENEPVIEHKENKSDSKTVSKKKKTDKKYKDIDSDDEPIMNIKKKHKKNIIEDDDNDDFNPKVKIKEKTIIKYTTSDDTPLVTKKDDKVIPADSNLKVENKSTRESSSEKNKLKYESKNTNMSETKYKVSNTHEKSVDKSSKSTTKQITNNSNSSDAPKIDENVTKVIPTIEKLIIRKENDSFQVKKTSEKEPSSEIKNISKSSDQQINSDLQSSSSKVKPSKRTLTLSTNSKDKQKSKNSIKKSDSVESDIKKLKELETMSCTVEIQKIQESDMKKYFKTENENFFTSTQKITNESAGEKRRKFETDLEKHLYPTTKEHKPLIIIQQNYLEEDDFTSSPTDDKFNRKKIIADIKKLETDIKKKKEIVTNLKQAEIYKNKHKIEDLNKLTDVWKNGCRLALFDLLKQLQAHGPIEMSSLLKKFKVPDTMVKTLNIVES